ncbi:MAG: VWA domain-containing protein [Gammaproteobacteria bacterium]|nr:VWA domain-containing protein [Gammaproteobacteria bacterium]
MKKIIALTTAALLLAGCDDDKPNPNAGTYGLSGTITGLSGDITLEVNGTDEVLTNNGDFVLQSRVTNGENYLVTVESTSKDLTCVITNGSGASESNVTDILIECDGTDQVAYSLNGLAFNTEKPSIVTFAFHLVDRNTEAALDNITTENLTDYLEVKENGSPISPSESFLEIDQLANLNAQYHTVFAIDISSSLQQSELDSIKSIVSDSILDEQTGESKLSANQYVTLLTFDSNVETLVTESQDANQLVNAIENIKLGGNSTNLHGALIEGTSIWQNDISLNGVEYGNLILFTDGIDTSAKASKDSAIKAVSEKDVYFIALGNEVSTAELQEFTSKNNIFSIDDFTELANVLDDALTRVKTFEDGLYVMSYATPKRAGNHTITITARDDYPCYTAVSEEESFELANNGKIADCHDVQSYSFNANNFDDVAPQLLLSGTTPSIANRVTWSAELRWTNAEISELDWTINVCDGVIAVEMAEDNTSAALTREGNVPAVAYIKVRDDLLDLEQSAYAIMAVSESDYLNYSPTSLKALCSN